MLLAGCTADPAPGPARDPGSVTATGTPLGSAPSTTPESWAAGAVWQRRANLAPPATLPALWTVYPLQRIDGRVLLTVDVTPQGASGQRITAMNIFSYEEFSGSMDDVSLIDPVHRVRYGPLRRQSPRQDLPYDGEPFASRERRSAKVAGTTYRYGAFFPDPGPAVAALSVDLLSAGVALDIPITDGGPTAPGLVTDGAEPASPSPGGPSGTTPVSAPSGSISGPGPAPDGGPLITITAPTPTPDAVVERHDLIAPIAGGAVNDSGAGARGLVTLNSDVLFAFDSSALTGQAGPLITRAGQILADRADPAKPIQITGYTDAKGTPAYNLELSRKRAAAVATALAALPDARGRSTSVTGKGEADPVAPNTTPDGGDDPAGRALNRRVEIAYTPTPPPAPTPSAPNPGASPTPATEGTEPTVALGPATVKSNGIFPVQMSAAVYPVIVTGSMSLIRLDITAATKSIVIDAFTGRDRAAQDVGRFRLIEPTTKAIHLAAYDADAHRRVLGTWTRRMDAGVAYHYFLYTAALPPEPATVTVDLGQLGTATVPIQRR
jgi:outer membrane protein OmpA-like peptidoglycan-associated protein